MVYLTEPSSCKKLVRISFNTNLQTKKTPFIFPFTLKNQATYRHYQTIDDYANLYFYGHD